MLCYSIYRLYIRCNMAYVRLDKDRPASSYSLAPPVEHGTSGATTISTALGLMENRTMYQSDGAY